MNEHFPEAQAEKDPPSRSELIRLLKENPDDLLPLHEYMQKREKEVEAEDGGGLTLILESVDIYIEAGFLQAAIDALEDAITLAQNEGNNEMVLELNQKLHTIHLS